MHVNRKLEKRKYNNSDCYLHLRSVFTHFHHLMQMAIRGCHLLPLLLFLSTMIASKLWRLTPQTASLGRSNFPRGFVFGSATSAYQVWLLLFWNHFLHVSKDPPSKMYMRNWIGFVFIYAGWRCRPRRWQRAKHLGHLHAKPPRSLSENMTCYGFTIH